MLAGAKGRALVNEMPPHRLLLETDGPFAQANRRALRPTDAATACRILADLWSTDYETVELTIRNNERTLLRLGAQTLGSRSKPDR